MREMPLNFNFVANNVHFADALPDKKPTEDLRANQDVQEGLLQQNHPISSVLRQIFSFFKLSQNLLIDLNCILDI